MDASTKEKIVYEISQIDNLIKDALPLINVCKAKQPDFVELCATGTILHSFYNGVENILLLYAKSRSFVFESNNRWHSELLEFCTKELQLSDETSDMLFEYMSFRHFFRHSYGFSLQWEKCSHLFLSLENNWNNIKEALHASLCC